MESTPGKRIQEWREFKKMSLTEVFRLTGIKVTTLSTAEQPGSSNPSYDTLTKLLAKFPDLNPDWLLLGTGSMLRDGRNLTPAPATQSINSVEPADEARMPATVKRKMHTPMAILRDLEEMTPERQIAYYKQRAETAEAQLADIEAAQRHEETVRLISAAGGRSFNAASLDAADTDVPPAMVAVTNQEYVARAAEAERVLIGFGRGR